MESKTNYELNDSELVLYVREENECAKEKLYEKYTPLIHKEINNFKKKAEYLGIDMADLSQEAMLAFSHAINNFKENEETKFITFVTLCIHRRLMNIIAKYDTNKNKVLGSSLPLDAIIEDTDNTILDLLEDESTSDPLRKMITDESLGEAMRKIDEHLSDNERLALKYDVEGKSVQEISELMGMNIKQIYNLIHRARKKVKK